MVNKKAIQKISPLVISILASTTAAALLYKPFLLFNNNFLEPTSGIGGLQVPADLNLILAVFDFSFVFFLALFLSFFYDWRETLRHWAYGYLLLIGLSIVFLAGAYLPSPIGILFILLSASAGLLIGQSLRYFWFYNKSKS